METGPRPVGLIVVRVWGEDGRLRARVTVTPDVERKAGEAVRYCASADQVCAVITQFFSDFPAGGAGATPA